MTLFLMFLGFAGGFALCWFARDKILVVLNGTESTIAKLEAKIALLKAAF